MKSILLINAKIQQLSTIVGILTFISRINATFESFKAKTLYFSAILHVVTVKHVLIGHSKIDKTKILMTNGGLM